MRRAAKVDRNQSEIVKALRCVGAFVVITSQLKNAFDILVAYQGRTYVIEIKDGELPPSKKVLTEGELKCKNGFNKVGVDYHIVESVDQAIELINMGHPNTL
jgi:hypothetical protein